MFWNALFMISAIVKKTSSELDTWKTFVKHELDVFQNGRDYFGQIFN